eukprot:2019141-Pyramimonas_sp.AAC.1
MAAAAPCEHTDWGPRKGSLGGRCANMGIAAPCERTSWGPRWRSPGSRKHVEDGPRCARRRHAKAATGAL